MKKLSLWSLLKPFLRFSLALFVLLSPRPLLHRTVLLNFQREKAKLSAECGLGVNSSVLIYLLTYLTEEICYMGVQQCQNLDYLG